MQTQKLCRKFAFLRQNPKIEYWKINSLYASTFLFSVICDRALMLERGVTVDHTTINRWVIKHSPQLEEAFHRCKRPVWISWCMDETYIRVKGERRYLYRTVDKHGQTIVSS